MAHYAFINSENIVVQVITGRNENDLPEGVTSWESYYGNLSGLECKRTSYNTRAGQHLLGGIPFRKNYASSGYTYDPSRDAFIPPKPFNSWTLNEESCLWEPPVEHPNDGEQYVWDENSTSWVLQ